MAVTNPKRSDLTAYEGNTFDFLYEFVDSGGSDIDLSADYSDIEFRIFRNVAKSSPEVSLTVSGGGLSITNTNELSGTVTAAQTNSLPEVLFYELVFTLSDGSTEVYLFGRFFVNDFQGSGEATAEFTITINQSTNTVTFADSYDAAAKATQAKVDAETAESNAQTSETNAASSASAASTSESNAADSAADAEKQAQNTTSFTDSDGDSFDKGAKGYASDASDSADTAESYAKPSGQTEKREPDVTDVFGFEQISDNTAKKIEFRDLARMANSEADGSYPSLLLYADRDLADLTTFTRNTVRRYWGSDGLLKEAAAGENFPSFDPATFARQGWPIMGQWTNEIFDWRDFSTNNWNRENSVSVGTDTGIDGASKNIKLTPDGTNNGRIRQDKAVPDDSNDHTIQVWLTKDMSANAKVEAVLSGGTGVTADVVVDTSDGSVVSGSADVTDAGDTWEVSFQITNNGSGNTNLSARFYPDNASQTSAQTFDVPSLFLDRSFAPPTPVFGNAAGQAFTQDPDMPTITDLSWFNASEGTFVVKFKSSVPQNNDVGLLRNSGADNINPIYFNSGAVKTFNGVSGGLTVAAGNAPYEGVAVVAYNENGRALGWDGTVNTDSTDFIDSSKTFEGLSIGKSLSNSFLEGELEYLKYYGRRLPEATLQNFVS